MARKNPHAVALGRRGGQSTSPAKVAAARRNAQRAGRPPKFREGDRVRANTKAPHAYRGRSGEVTKAYPGRSEFAILFDDGGGIASRGRLMSWCLDRE